MSDKDSLYSNFLQELANNSNNKKTPGPILPSKKRETVNNSFIPKSEIRNIETSVKVQHNYHFNRDKYEEVYIDNLPMGDFYLPETKILMCECDVEQIQNFSTYDINNPFDFKNKLNDIIESCIIFINPDGTINNHLNLYDGDRTYLIYGIREKTFTKGTILTTTVTYKDVENKDKKILIENIRANVDIWKNQEIMKFYNKDKNCFVFETTLRDEPFYILPPSIGLMNCFDQYMIIKEKEKRLSKDKDSPFFKIAPYLKPGVSTMNFSEMEEFEKWFKTDLTPDEYSFLLDLINNHLKIGIRGLKKNTPSGVIRTNKIYPDNKRSLFIVPNAFGLYLRQQA